VYVYVPCVLCACCCLQEKEAILQKLQADVSALQDKCKLAEVSAARKRPAQLLKYLLSCVKPCVCPSVLFTGRLSSHEEE
jgi:hypothetical protein